MQSLAEIYARHGGSDCHTGSDKGTVHSYIPVYAGLLEPYRSRPEVRVLEIGLLTGHSLLAWEEYFAGEVWGIDASDQPLNGMADLRPLIATGKHKIVIGDACDPSQVALLLGDRDFDVIIEDASHGLTQQLALYAVFRDRLRPGGLYIIEDVYDIDASRQVLEALDPRREVNIVDLRSVKGRFDDVLVVVRQV
jgi:SAM-dependent methyltransferase